MPARRRPQRASGHPSGGSTACRHGRGTTGHPLAKRLQFPQCSPAEMNRRRNQYEGYSYRPPSTPCDSKATAAVRQPRTGSRGLRAELRRQLLAADVHEMPVWHDDGGAQCCRHTPLGCAHSDGDECGPRQRRDRDSRRGAWTTRGTSRSGQATRRSRPLRRSSGSIPAKCPHVRQRPRRPARFPRRTSPAGGDRHPSRRALELLPVGPPRLGIALPTRDGAELRAGPPTRLPLSVRQGQCIYDVTSQQRGDGGAAVMLSPGSPPWPPPPASRARCRR